MENPISTQQLQQLSDEELLQRQIRSLGLRIDGTRLEKSVNQLYTELSARDIHFHPSCYLTDEWLSPDGIAAIGIPFYLAHPRLVQLERQMMLEVEGGTEQWCLKLLRHEAGHAFNHAYQLYRKTRWRELFGTVTKRYITGSYPVQPYSKRYVIHLQDHYAQSHPEEDFAETFAVWLDPHSEWAGKYYQWPALKKLKYVDYLMKNSTFDAIPSMPKVLPYDASRMRSTLTAYYKRKRRWLKKGFPGYYDPALTKIFTANHNEHSVCKASHFLRTQKTHIVNSVSRWTGQRKYDVDELIKKLANRCDEMSLYLHNADALFDITAFVAAIMSNRVHFTGITTQDNKFDDTQSA